MNPDGKCTTNKTDTLKSANGDAQINFLNKHGFEFTKWAPKIRIISNIILKIINHQAQRRGIQRAHPQEMAYEANAQRGVRYVDKAAHMGKSGVLR